MDNQGWIKLYRKLADHDILRDPTSLQIFIWLLLNVDRKTGGYTTGRFVASQVLGMKPRTFHKAITERLQHRYDLVTLSSDNKKTTIYLKNWDKYQSLGDTPSDTKVTTKGQQSDTKQEVISKKKESNIYKHLPEKEEVTGEQIEQIAKQYSVSPANVKDIWESIFGYCHSKGEKYANFYATTQNWVRRAIKDKKILVIKQEDDYVRRLNEASR